MGEINKKKLFVKGLALLQNTDQNHSPAPRTKVKLFTSFIVVKGNQKNPAYKGTEYFDICK